MPRLASLLAAVGIAAGIAVGVPAAATAQPLTHAGTPGCRVTNNTDMPIDDPGFIEDPVGTTGCPGNASAHSTVEAHIKHPYRAT